MWYVLDAMRLKPVVLVVVLLIEIVTARIRKEFRLYEGVNFVTGPDSTINDEQDIQMMEPTNTLEDCQEYCENEEQCRFIWYYEIAPDLSLCELYKKKPKMMQWFEDFANVARFYEVTTKIKPKDSDDLKNIS